MSTDRPLAFIQARLLWLAWFFLVFYAGALSLAPATAGYSFSLSSSQLHWYLPMGWAIIFGLTHWHIQRRLGTYDPYLLPIAGLLSGWGLLTIWRLNPDLATKQFIWLVLGVALLNAGIRWPGILDQLSKYKYLWLVGGLLLTAATLYWGTNPTGSGPQLWLGYGELFFQPSEALKLLLVVFIAAYLADRQIHQLQLPVLLAPTLLVTGLCVVILMYQRDLGTAFILLFLFLAIIFLGTNNRQLILIGSVGFLILGLAGYYLFDVVQLRVDAWLFPWEDPSGRSYQLVQSMIAMASGGIMGRGPGMGMPWLVPLSQSDFIFAAIVEETGLLGGLGILLLISLLLTRGLQIALNAQLTFHQLLAGGLTTLLVAQSILIIGGNIRLNPLTGVTLPFVSYGGSSLVTSYFAVLLLILVSSRKKNGGRNEKKNQDSFRWLAYGLGIGIALLALLLGYWSTVRGPALLARTDNFRRAIGDLYVPRGQFFDRYSTPMTNYSGTPGSLQRKYLYPSLGNLLGYSNLRFGQSGLEASLDTYLRGETGSRAFDLWWTYLLYGQHPTGRDVKLTLSLPLQTEADKLFDGYAGAVVMINANSGEILVAGSYPGFDPNTLGETWEELIYDETTPLVNRALLGQYPPGASFGPALYAATISRTNLPPLPEDTSDILNGNQIDCAIPVLHGSWDKLVQNGCPAALVALGDAFNAENIQLLYDQLNYYQQSGAYIPALIRQPQTGPTTLTRLSLGANGILISPLQAALSAAFLSNGGSVPSPQLVLSVDIADAGWTSVDLPNSPIQVIPASAANSAATALAGPIPHTWFSVGFGYDPGEGYAPTTTWFTGGTLSTWQGEPLAIAVLIEKNAPDEAKQIGLRLLQLALEPNQ